MVIRTIAWYEQRLGEIVAKARRRYGELLFLVEPDVLSCLSLLEPTVLRSMHGYDPEHPASFAMYAINADDVRAPESRTGLYALLSPQVAA